MYMNNETSQTSGCFLNFSNHPSAGWTPEQRDAALGLGRSIVDIPFPQVRTDASEEEITRIAREYATAILAASPAAVMCMGEFGVCYQVIRALKEQHIRVVYTCTERCTEERITETGTQKYSVFRFVRFRTY